jgi:hypothetical protein
MRVVVVGAMGNFGARICSRLAHEPGMTVIGTGRRTTPSLDITDPKFADALKSLAPDLVIHCAGPFQGQDYRVALAALGCGANYVDIADGREFVAGFAAAVGPAAQAAGCIAVTGASTLPALSSAVVDHLEQGIAALHEIEIAIAPGQHAPRGIATMKAVLSYAGRPFQWREHGSWRTVHGWQELKRMHFSFGSRLAAACDVPDLSVLPQRYPSARTVTFRAALEVSVQHYFLWAIGACRRMGLPIPVGRWAPWLNRAAGWFDRFGSETGGMTVRLGGTDAQGQRLCRTWQLLAEHNCGPEIPCMAAVLLACKLGRGEPLPSGARVCAGILTLADFQVEFARFSISTTVDDAR